jgi:uncharacterized protein GlcG (DUF336 family)
MALSTAEAQRILQAAQAKAQEMGVKVGISVVDGRGDLLTMVRLDGASWRSPILSRGKAMASVTFGISSGDLAERANTPVMQAMMISQAGNFVPGQGALPINRGGEVIGAVGVSGGTSQEDEDIARAGINAL